MNRFYKMILNSIYEKHVNVNRMPPIVALCLSKKEIGVKNDSTECKEGQEIKKEDIKIL